MSTPTSPVPAHRPPTSNPVDVYLAGLGTQASRKTMAASLETVVKIAAELVARPADLDLDPRSFGFSRLDHASAIAIRAALAARYAPATTNRHLASMRGVVRTSGFMGIVSSDQVGRILAGLTNVSGESLPAGRLITHGELEAMFRVLASRNTPSATRDAALLAVLAGTGARRAEIVGLDLADWNADAGELVIRHAKGGRQRMAYLHGGAADAIEDWIALRGAAPGPLFVAVRKDGYVDPELRRLSTNAIWRRCQLVARQAGVPTTSPHDHRRTAASTLLSTADIVVVAGLLGHRQVTTTARYDRRPEHARRSASEAIHVPYVRRDTPAPGTVVVPGGARV